MPNRKLNKATDQRDAMLRNMVTAFLWNGKLVTTESRAKEVRPIAEKLITLAGQKRRHAAPAPHSQDHARPGRDAERK